MNEIIKNIEAAQLKAEVPAFNTGDTVRVHALIKEGNRERVQVFEGTVLKKQGGSNRATFTVRKSSNGVGVAFPGGNLLQFYILLSVPATFPANPAKVARQSVQNGMPPKESVLVPLKYSPQKVREK